MGHIRLGRLPRSQNWQQLIDLLGAPAPEVPTVAVATARGANQQLRRLRNDPSLGYCFWLLARLGSAARRPDFTESLAPLGLQADPTDSVPGFIAQVGERARTELERYPGSGPFGELASLALRRALTETVGTEGRSLFGSTLEDLERAFRRHAGPTAFGELSQRFFGDFLARTLRFYVDKELLLHVGPDQGIRNLAESDAFLTDLDRYARQSARIVEDFAADWYRKHDWQAEGAISHDEAQAFVAHALTKLRGELTEPQA